MFRSTKKKSAAKESAKTDSGSHQHNGSKAAKTNLATKYNIKNYLENENAKSTMLVATPIRVAMNNPCRKNKQNYVVNNDNHNKDTSYIGRANKDDVVLKSALTVSSQLPQRSVGLADHCQNSKPQHSTVVKEVNSTSITTTPTVKVRRPSSAESFDDVVLRKRISSSSFKMVPLDENGKIFTNDSVSEKTPIKRSSDSMRRKSGHQIRRQSSSDVPRKRNSDPVTLSAFASFKSFFSVKSTGSPQAFPSSHEQAAGLTRQNTVKTTTKHMSKSSVLKTNVNSTKSANNSASTRANSPSNATFYTNEASNEDLYLEQSAPLMPAKTPLRKSIRNAFFNSSNSSSKSQNRTPHLRMSDTDIDRQVDGSNERRWARSNSLRRPFQRSRENNENCPPHHHNDSTCPSVHSDTELCQVLSVPHSLDGQWRTTSTEGMASERGVDVGRVSAWGTSFEKLLEDPAGLHTFAEFLKKEYSHENIYFWTACERYRHLSDSDELQATAKVIFERHLCIGAPEPVNVDSQARQDAEDSLNESPNEFLFSQAQKQIFHLMKFDSYSRFLKSSLYQDCLSCQMRGETLPYPGNETLDPDLRIQDDPSHFSLKKSKSDADERRRKSLLPWHRKDRSKSKDRGETEYRRRQQKKKKTGATIGSNRNQSESSSSIPSDMSGSRTSLNSTDTALGRRALSKESLTSGELGSLSGNEGFNRCRVILPDLSNSVVAVRIGDTIQDLLTRLLERRGITYSTFEVYVNKTDKLLDKTEESSALGGLEVRIEQRILFRLDLPNNKTVCVKAKPNKVTSDVLKPILHKYGYKLDLMVVHKVGEEKSVTLKAPINDIDSDRLIVQTKEEAKEWGSESAQHKELGGKNSNNHQQRDEITNRVFEDLLKGKTQQQQQFDELGILDFDAKSSKTDQTEFSDRSSGTTGFGLRNSLANEKNGNRKGGRNKNRQSVHDNLHHTRSGGTSTSDSEGIPIKGVQENNQLYEGLKRAQRSRLDDQRGTEINFELPEFLKQQEQQKQQQQEQQKQKQQTTSSERSKTRNQRKLSIPFSQPQFSQSQDPTHTECSKSHSSEEHLEDPESYLSVAHPEVWGGMPPTASLSSNSSANATLVAPYPLLDDEFDDTLVGIELDDSVSLSQRPTLCGASALPTNGPDCLYDENQHLIYQTPTVIFPVHSNHSHKDQHCNHSSSRTLPSPPITPPPPYVHPPSLHITPSTPPPPLPPKTYKKGGGNRIEQDPPPRPPPTCQALHHPNFPTISPLPYTNPKEREETRSKEASSRHSTPTYGLIDRLIDNR